MRQYMLDSYAAWINWCFDHPWVFAVGMGCYVLALVLQRRARRGRWGR